MNADSIIKTVWSYVCGVWRAAAPSLTVAAAIIAAYVMGSDEASFYWLLAPMILASFALGATADRESARARNETALTFLRLIETDHELQVTVTHRRED